MLLRIILICFPVILLINGQDVICRFYNLKADCRYRLDGFHMVIIQAEINKCSDPVEVTFHIKDDQPYLDWSGTFSKNKETKTVDGLDVSVELHVLLVYDENKDFFVKADFDVSNQYKAYFLHDTVHLNTEDCIVLNKAGQIAVGCMLVLLLIASVLLVVLLYFRYKRKVRQHQSQSLVFVDNIESPCEETASSPASVEPPAPLGSSPSVESPPVRFNVQTQRVNQNST